MRAGEFGEFNRFLASVVERGLPIEDAVEEAGEQSECRRLREAAAGAAAGLREGRPLAEAMGRFPKVFPADYCALVDAGVKGGALAPILRGVATEYALKERLNQGAWKLASYFIAVLGIFAFLGIPVGFMARQWRRLFEDLKMLDDLPTVTELVLDMGEFIWLMPAAVLIVGAVLLIVWRTVMRWIGRSGAVYWIPLIGRLQKAHDLAVWCTLLSLRLRMGTPLSQALAEARGVVRNRRFRNIIDIMGTRLAEGRELSAILFYLGFFPRTLAWAVSLGEARAEVPEVLGTFGELYAAEQKRNYDILFVLLAPLSVLVLGNIAFLFMMAMFLPIIDIQHHLMGG